MKQDKLGYSHGAGLNIYILYELKKDQQTVLILLFLMDHLEL